MKDFPEISLGVKRNEEGEPLVYVDGVLCGTVENLKRSVDRYWDDEIQRKLAEAGVCFTMTDGVPKISVPASAAHMVEIEGERAKKLDASMIEYLIKAASGEIPGFRLRWEDDKPNWTIIADQFVVDPSPASTAYDPRKDPNFASAVEAAVRDGGKRRSL